MFNYAGENFLIERLKISLVFLLAEQKKGFGAKNNVRKFCINDIGNFFELIHEEEGIRIRFFEAGFIEKCRIEATAPWYPDTGTNISNSRFR